MTIYSVPGSVIYIPSFLLETSFTFFACCPQDPTYTERFHFSALCLCTWSSLCWACVGTVPPLTPPWPGSLPLSFRIMQKHQFLQETFPDPHALAQVRAGCSS